MEDFASENEREADASCAPDTVPLNFEVIYQWIDYYDRRQTSAYRARDEWVQVAGEKSTDDRDRFVEDEYALLLPDRVFGFVLRSRTWGKAGHSQLRSDTVCLCADLVSSLFRHATRLLTRHHT